MWNTLIGDLKTHLTTSCASFTGGTSATYQTYVGVQTGPKIPCVILLRDREPDECIHNGTRGTVLFVAESHIIEAGTPEAAYGTLNTLETALRVGITSWQDVIEAGAGADCIVDIVGGILTDEFKPNLVSQLIIQVKWDKRGH